VPSVWSRSEPVSDATEVDYQGRTRARCYRCGRDDIFLNDEQVWECPDCGAPKMELLTRQELVSRFHQFLDSPDYKKLGMFFQALDSFIEARGPDARIRYMAYEGNSPTNAAKHLTRRAREVLNAAPHRGALQMIADGLTEALALAELDGEP
jgi:hypothetical protein